MCIRDSHNTPETKQQSKQWTTKGKLIPKKAKTIPSASKVMATVFGDNHGVIFIDYLKKEETINGKYYANPLNIVNDEIDKKQPHLVKKCCFTKTIHISHRMTSISFLTSKMAHWEKIY